MGARCRPVWPGRGNRGYALADLVVGMAVFALVLVGVYQVFVPVLRFAASASERLAVQQDVRLAVDRMARDLRESAMSAGRLEIYAGGAAIGLATARANCSGDFSVDGATGKPRWQAVIYIVFDQASGEVRRYCDSTTTFTAASPPTAGPYQVLARNVQALAFAIARDPITGNEIGVTVTLHERTPRGDADRHIRTEFVPQND